MYGPMNDDLISPKDREARIARWERIGPRLIQADLESGRHRLVGGEPWTGIAWEWLRQKDAAREGALAEAADPSGMGGLTREIKERYRELVGRARAVLKQRRRRQG